MLSDYAVNIFNCSTKRTHFTAGSKQTVIDDDWDDFISANLQQKM